MLRRRPSFKTITLIVSLSLLLAGLRLYWEIRRDMRLIHLPATALLEDRHGNFLAESGGADAAELGYWTLADDIPARIKAAFLVTEDRRFYQHPGLDARALARAAWHNLTSSRRQGASTIAMQVARMQRALRPPAARRTYWNKLCETIIALGLIRKFGHEAVLKQYLEFAPQGNRMHGVAYAARRYFRKPLRDVSWAEAAILAALPQAPGTLNLYQPAGRQKALTRADLILRLLARHSELDAQDLRAAQRQLANFVMPVKETRPPQSYHAILRLEDILRPDWGHTPLTKAVRASLDLSVQTPVADIMQTALTQHRAVGVGNGAALVVETATGQVVAYVGSAAYYDSQAAGAINYARVPRSSGSTLKPFIYALGLESGAFTPASLLSDAPLLAALPGGYYQIGNIDGQNLGRVLYRKALANSRNVPAVHVLARVGLERTYEFFRQLGLVTRPGRAGYYGLGMALGTLYVTLEDLVTAYGVLANEGRAFQLQWFADRDFAASFAGQRRILAGEQWMTPDVARQITLFLADPFARLPVFARMGPLEYPFPVAVKTGTSQGYRDAWAVAYSAKYVVGVWLGHPAHKRMHEVGGVVAAQIVKDIMFLLHPAERRGVGVTAFPPPAGYSLVNLCVATGRPATPACSEVMPEYFRPGTEPPAADITPPVRASQENPAVTSFAPTAEARAPGAEIAWQQNPAFAATLRPFTYEHLLNASVIIQEPRSGGVFVIDPDTPRTLQTVTFRAQVAPQVAHVVWQVDGQPFATTAYPYTVRWPLSPGQHTIQARFAQANIVSDVVTITVH